MGKKIVKVVRLEKTEAVAKWRELKRRLRAGEIAFEEYAREKRRIKPSILAV